MSKGSGRLPWEASTGISGRLGESQLLAGRRQQQEEGGIRNNVTSGAQNRTSGPFILASGITKVGGQSSRPPSDVGRQPVLVFTNLSEYAAARTAQDKRVSFLDVEQEWKDYQQINGITSSIDPDVYDIDGVDDVDDGYDYYQYYERVGADGREEGSRSKPLNMVEGEYAMDAMETPTSQHPHNTSMWSGDIKQFPDKDSDWRLVVTRKPKSSSSLKGIVPSTKPVFQHQGYDPLSLRRQSSDEDLLNGAGQQYPSLMRHHKPKDLLNGAGQQYPSLPKDLLNGADLPSKTKRARLYMSPQQLLPEFDSVETEDIAYDTLPPQQYYTVDRLRQTEPITSRGLDHENFQTRTIRERDRELLSHPSRLSSQLQRTPLRIPITPYSRGKQIVESLKPAAIAAIPNLKDTTVESFIDSIELLFPEPEQAAKVAWLKLTEDLRFYLDAGNVNRVVTWEQIKSLLLLERKRTSDKQESAYFSFRQTEDETIVTSWRRFMGLANAADVKETRSSLWQYFKVRLTHVAKMQFREELKDPDPISALERIAEAGDVATIKPSPAYMMSMMDENKFSSSMAKVLAFSDKFRGNCYNCGSYGHMERNCRKPQKGSHVPEKVPLTDPKSDPTPKPTIGQGYDSNGTKRDEERNEKRGHGKSRKGDFRNKRNKNNVKGHWKKGNKRRDDARGDRHKAEKPKEEITKSESQIPKDLLAAFQPQGSRSQL